MSDLPELALSLRQPWAWAVVHAGKPLENRSAAALRFMVPLLGQRAIHASVTMTRAYYCEARDFMRNLGLNVPAPADLLRGGIIGQCEFTAMIKGSDSPWFFGPRALVVKDARPCGFIPCGGQLGYFKWQRHPTMTGPVPALPWMLPKPEDGEVVAPPAKPKRQMDMFG